MHRDGGGRRRRALLALAALAAGGCGGGAPDKTLQQIASWAESAQLAAQNRAAGATSARYTRNVLHATHAELLQNVQALHAALDSSKDSSRLAPPQRVEARDAAASVEEAVAAMARLADEEPDDVAALLAGAARLSEPGATAKALADSAKKP